MSDLEIRSPLAARIYVGVFCTLWCSLVVYGGVRGALAGSVQTLVLVPMFAAGATVGYRLFWLGVRTEHDTMTVRNNFRTRTLSRADIEGFRTGSLRAGSLPGSEAVHVLLRDESLLALDVTVSAFPLPGSRKRLQERLQQLQAWHRG
ncbi:MAG TPA: hypothetical protein VFR07_05390 [Mycobacteriales bacterium]|nr:hypothetical protein [Mycobacteriales bacterium]